MERRDVIADAGIRLVARDGVHALTHRRVDAEAGLPAGSTSYYARTRGDLVALVAARLSDGSAGDLDSLVVPDALTPVEAGWILAGLARDMAGRGDAQAARFLLMLEVRADPELRDLLTPAAAVRNQVTHLAARLLAALGVAEEGRDVLASQFAVLVDALLMYDTSHAEPVDLENTLTAYLRGILG